MYEAKMFSPFLSSRIKLVVSFQFFVMKKNDQKDETKNYERLIIKLAADHTSKPHEELVQMRSIQQVVYECRARFTSDWKEWLSKILNIQSKSPIGFPWTNQRAL